MLYCASASAVHSKSYYFVSRACDRRFKFRQTSSRVIPKIVKICSQEAQPMETARKSFFLKLDEIGMIDALAVGKKMLPKLSKYVFNFFIAVILCSKWCELICHMRYFTS